MGRRAQDVRTAQRIQALASACRSGTFAYFITLTVDRSWWQARGRGPAECYDQVNERPRRVLAALRKFLGYDDLPAVTVLEVQGRTGDGWPHYHIVVLNLPSWLTEADVRRVVESAWVIRDGEDKSVGFVDVDRCRSVQASAHYLSKYVTKVWIAVPGWMLESSTRFRKVRLSAVCYDILERLHLHQRRRLDRVRPPTRRLRPTRPLLQRMAASGTGWIVMRVDEDGRMKFVRALRCDPARAARDLAATRRAQFICGPAVSDEPIGDPARLRVVVDRRAFNRTVGRCAGRWALQADALHQDNARRIESEWERHQAQRAREEWERSLPGVRVASDLVEDGAFSPMGAPTGVPGPGH